MRRSFKIVIQRVADGFLVAAVPALPGCQTWARSADDLIAQVREAVELYLEVEDDGVRLNPSTSCWRH